MIELTTLSAELDQDPAVGAIVSTGSAGVCCGPNIKEMSRSILADMYAGDGPPPGTGYRPSGRRSSLQIAGYASKANASSPCSATSSSPPTPRISDNQRSNSGLSPSAASQRLTRAIGKAKAMELPDRRTIDAHEAERSASSPASLKRTGCSTKR